MADAGTPRASPSERLFADDRRLVGLLVGASLGVFAVQLDFFSIQAAIPRMADDLDSSAAALQWVVGGYMLSTSAFLIVGGRLADIFGRRNWFVAGAAIFGLASLGGGLAESAEMVIVMRLVMGVGSAILFPVGLAIVTNAFPPAKLQQALGVVFTIGAVALALGPGLGGVLTDALSWRWVLWLNVPVTVLIVVLAAARVPESRDDTVPRSIDWGGLALVVVSIAAFTYGIDRSSEWGWSSPTTLGLVGGGLLGLAAFVAVEVRIRYPLLDLSLFRIRVFSVMTLAGAIGNGGAVVLIFYSMVYLQDVHGYSAIAAGVTLLPLSVGYAVAAVISGRMERFPPATVMGIALATGGLAVVGMGLVSPIDLYLGFVFFAGLGFGTCWSFSSVVTQSVVPQRLAGAASGTVLTVMISFGAVCLAVATTFYKSSTSSGAADEGDVIQAILLAMGVVAAAVAPVVAVLGRGRHREPATAIS